MWEDSASKMTADSPCGVNELLSPFKGARLAEALPRWEGKTYAPILGLACLSVRALRWNHVVGGDLMAVQAETER